MAVTVSATLLRRFRSIAAAVVTTNGFGSLEVVTVNHRLGVCPDLILPVLRTATAIPGVAISIESLTGFPALAVRSWNMSQVLLDGPIRGAGGVVGSPVLAIFDIICERVTAMNR